MSKHQNQLELQDIEHHEMPDDHFSYLVCVYKDGTVEWLTNETDESLTLAPEQQLAAKKCLQELTGMGNPERWRAWTSELITDAMDICVTDDTPVPVAVRGGVSRALLLDYIEYGCPISPLFFIETYISYDGNDWFDVDESVLPAELQNLSDSSDVTVK